MFHKINGRKVQNTESANCAARSASSDAREVQMPYAKADGAPEHADTKLISEAASYRLILPVGARYGGRARRHG